MGLSATLNTAQQALSTNAALSSIVGRNIAGVNDANYTRKTGNVETTVSGSAAVVSVTNAADVALLAKLLSANSASASASALSAGLDTLEQTVSLTNAASASSTTATTTDTSPATAIGTLATALQSYAANPSDSATGATALSAAKALAANLNAATATVQSVREQADASIAASVQTVNTLLTQFQTANDAVIRNTASGQDATDAIDSRNGILQSLSQQMGISTIKTANGGLSIYTDSGVTLFEGTARTVAFTATSTYTAGSTGGAVTVDGVAVTGANATMPIKGGAIAGLATLRDTTAVSYQNQLDQMAQGLISAFADSDQTGGGAATIPGLFTAPGASATATTTTAGLAGQISVSANVDPSRGGTLTLLRDGGIGDPSNSAYKANTTGAGGYSTHLTALLASLDASRSFDATSGGSATGTLASYASSSVSWLEAARQSATTDTTNTAAVVSAATTTLSNASGVNLDTELSKMLDLEHSYSASAQLMSSVKTMFDSLLSAIQ